MFRTKKQEAKAVRGRTEEIVDAVINEVGIGRIPVPFKDETPNHLLLRHYEQFADVVSVKVSNRLGMVMNSRNVYDQVSSMFRAVFGVGPCIDAGIPNCVISRF